MILLCLPVLSFLIGIFAVKNFKMEISAPKTAKRNTATAVTVETKCGFLFPKYKIQLKTTLLPYGEVKNENREGCYSRTEVFDVNTEYSGIALLDFTESAVYDFLGLFRFKIKDAISKEILVLPIKTLPDSVPNPRCLAEISKKTVRGPADEYDIREYREGDGLNRIHWKVSAKTDKLMVKEGLEPVKRKNAVSLDLKGTREELESVFGQLIWVADELFDSGNSFNLYWKNKIENAYIYDKESLYSALYAVMSTKVGSSSESLRNVRLAEADWHYHISPKKAVEKK